MSNMTKLVLNCNISYSSVESIFRNLKNLTHLKLSFSFQSDKSESLFPSIHLPILFRCIKHLEDLSLTQDTFDNSMPPLYEQFEGADLSGLKELRQLELVGIQMIPEISFDKLAQLPKLKYVEYRIGKYAKVIYDCFLIKL